VKRDALPLPAHGSLAGHAGSSTTWRVALLVLAVALVLEIVGYWPTAATMDSIWENSPTFMHGFTVLPISAWLVYRQRDALRACAPVPTLVVLPVIALAGLMWLAGEFGSVNAVSQSAFVGMLVLTIVAVLGLEVGRTIMFPLGFLFFAVPIGDFLLPTLMEWTANFTVAALRVTGVPVYREGLLINVPNGRWSIVEACSGVRYLIASLMVGTLFAYLNYRAMWRRWVFVGIAIAVPIVANWVRAYLIVLIGYLSDNRLAAGVDHLIYGWLFFGVVMLLMFGIGTRWREPPGEARSSTVLPLVSVPLGTVRSTDSRRYAVVAVAACALAIAWPIVDAATEVSLRPTPVLALGAIPGWRPVVGEVLPVQATAASAWSQALYQRDGRTVGIAVAYYHAQDARRKLARISTLLFSDESKHIVRTIIGEGEVHIGSALQRVVETHAQTPSHQPLVMWEWYWVDGRTTQSSGIAKILVSWSRLVHRRDDSAAVMLFTVDDQNLGREALAQFARDGWPEIRAMLSREAGH
jgi:exosortase A